MNIFENYNSAKQKYGEELVKTLYNKGIPPQYLLSACRFSKEGVNSDNLKQYFKQWMMYVVKNNKDIDINKLSFNDFYQTIQRYKLKHGIPNKIYSDDIASLGKLNNAKDVQKIPVRNQWCIKSQKCFDEYTNKGYVFFVIYLPNEPLPYTYVIAAVCDGDVEYYDSYDYELFEDLRGGNVGKDDHWDYQNKLPESITAYLYNIAASQGESLEIKKNKLNQQTNEDKSVKKTISFTESELRNIVTNVVSTILNEA